MKHARVSVRAKVCEVAFTLDLISFARRASVRSGSAGTTQSIEIRINDLEE
jgi:hypothetical protein